MISDKVKNMVQERVCALRSIGLLFSLRWIAFSLLGFKPDVTLQATMQIWRGRLTLYLWASQPLVAQVALKCLAEVDYNLSA